MILTVAVYKGGVAKTTTAVYAAGVLGLQKPTLLIDRDWHPGALRWYQREPAGASRPSPRRSLRRAREALQAGRERRRRHACGSDQEELVTFGSRSDVVLVPTTPDALAVEALVATVRDLKDAGVPFRVLLVAVPPAPSKQGTRTRSALQRAGLPVLKVEVPRAVAFHHAALAGRLVKDIRDRRSGELWEAYERVARESQKTGGATS